MADNFNRIANGITFVPQSTTPTSPTNGDVWYDAVTNKFLARVNGITVILGAPTGTANTMAIFNGSGDLASSSTLYDNTGVAAITLTSTVRNLFYVDGTTAALDFVNGQLNDQTGVLSVDFETRSLVDSSLNSSVLYQSRTLNDSAGQISVDWESRNLTDSFGVPQLYWTTTGIGVGTATPSTKFDVIGAAFIQGDLWLNAFINDASNVNSIDPTNRQLLDASGVPVATWSTLGINIASGQIYTTALNGSVFLTPSGFGYISAQVPDSTAAGGNVRGNNAVDWQTVRFGPQNVASGTWSVIGGGDGNESSGIASTVAGGHQGLTNADYATIGGGYQNYAPGVKSTISGGGNNSATGIASTIAGGTGNLASGATSAVLGGNNGNATASYATVVGGNNNVASGQYSVAMGGAAATTADFDFVIGNKNSSGSVDNVHFRVAGDTSDVHIGRNTDQAAVAGASNQLMLHTIFASNQSRYVGIKAPDTLAASYTLVLPPDDGNAGQALITDGSGVLSFAGVTLITGTTSTGATAGSVFFAGAAGVLQEDNANFFWDDTAKRLGIGTATPVAALDIVGAVGASTGQFFTTTTNGSVHLTPNGIGYISAHVADSTAAGGNARGNNAVDWQTVRFGAANVASGTWSVISGGDGNEASGTGSVVSGGHQSIVNADYATLSGGYQCYVAGQYASVGGGYQHVATGTNTTIAGGHGNTASAERATVGGGGNNNATGNSATVPGGFSNQAIHDHSFAAGSGSKTTAAFDVVFGNDSGGTPSVDFVHLRLDGSSSDLHIGRNTDQSAVGGASNKLMLHTILASNQSRSVALKAPDTLAASYTLTLPATYGTLSQSLTADGSGGLSWTGGAFAEDWTSGTTHTTTHNLGTRDVQVEIYDNATYDTVMTVTNTVRTTTNTIDFTTALAPSGAGWRILIRAQ